MGCRVPHQRLCPCAAGQLVGERPPYVSYHNIFIQILHRPPRPPLAASAAAPNLEGSGYHGPELPAITYRLRSTPRRESQTRMPGKRGS